MATGNDGGRSSVPDDAGNRSLTTREIGSCVRDDKHGGSSETRSCSSEVGHVVLPCCFLKITSNPTTGACWRDWTVKMKRLTLGVRLFGSEDWNVSRVSLFCSCSRLEPALRFASFSTTRCIHGRTMPCFTSGVAFTAWGFPRENVSRLQKFVFSDFLLFFSFKGYFWVACSPRASTQDPASTEAVSTFQHLGR